MPAQTEIDAALKAFNEVRVQVGGIKTEADQQRAMRAALEAAQRQRRIIDGLEAQ